MSQLSQDTARAIIESLGPGMKEAELRQHLTCMLCAKKIMHNGLPFFWRVKLERFGIDMVAVRRQSGLAMVLGSAPIAMVMGPDEDMAKPIMDPVTLTVCDDCACMRALPIAALAEVKR